MDEFKLEIENKEAVIKWLEDIRKGTGNAVPLWKAITPKTIEFIDYEFDPDQDGHKLWPMLSTEYLIWKIRVKGVSGIGYLSGAMREAAGREAIKEYKAQSFLWKLNDTVSSEDGKDVSDYVYRFHYGFSGSDARGRVVDQPARPIYKYTQIRLNNFLKLDAKRFNDGTKHANFTYNWLRKELEKGYK